MSALPVGAPLRYTYYLCLSLCSIVGMTLKLYSIFADTDYDIFEDDPTRSITLIESIIFHDYIIIILQKDESQ